MGEQTPFSAGKYKGVGVEIDKGFSLYKGSPLQCLSSVYQINGFKGNVVKFKKRVIRF